MSISFPVGISGARQWHLPMHVEQLRPVTKRLILAPAITGWNEIAVWHTGQD